jgi:hypothetical protein
MYCRGRTDIVVSGQVIPAPDKNFRGQAPAGIQFFEFGSERIPRGSLRGKRANDERCYSLRIEDSPQLAVERFNYKTNTYEEEK